MCTKGMIVMMIDGTREAKKKHLLCGLFLFSSVMFLVEVWSCFVYLYRWETAVNSMIDGRSLLREEACRIEDA